MQTPLIEEYSVVRGADVTTLVRNVSTAIRDGFQPLGGIAFSADHGGHYLQAVVKYEGAELLYAIERCSTR
jgi:hypothetical protein